MPDSKKRTKRAHRNGKAAKGPVKMAPAYINLPADSLCRCSTADNNRSCGRQTQPGYRIFLEVTYEKE